MQGSPEEGYGPAELVIDGCPTGSVSLDSLLPYCCLVRNEGRRYPRSPYIHTSLWDGIGCLKLEEVLFGFWETSVDVGVRWHEMAGASLQGWRKPEA